MALIAGQDDVLISAAGRDHVLTLTARHDNVLTLIPEREGPGAEELPELGAGDPEVERLHRKLVEERSAREALAQELKLLKETLAKRDAKKAAYRDNHFGQNAPDHLDHSDHDFSNHCELINWNEHLLIN